MIIVTLTTHPPTHSPPHSRTHTAGTMFGIALTKTRLPAVTAFCLLSCGYLFASRKEVDSVELPYLNRARLSYSAQQFLTTGECAGGSGFVGVGVDVHVIVYVRRYIYLRTCVRTCGCIHAAAQSLDALATHPMVSSQASHYPTNPPPPISKALSQTLQRPTPRSHCSPGVPHSVWCWVPPLKRP